MMSRRLRPRTPSDAATKLPGLPPDGLGQCRVGPEDVAADAGGRHVAGSSDAFRHALSIAATEG